MDENPTTNNVPQNQMPDQNEPIGAPVQQSAPKKSNKGLMIGLICGAGVLVIGVVVTVLMLTVFNGGISRRDFGDAQKLAQSMATYINDSSNIASNIDSTSTKEDIANAATELRNFQTEIRSNMDKLADMKAIKKDKGASDRFAALKAAHVEFDDNLSFLIEIYDKAMPVFVDMVGFGDKFGSISDESQVSAMIAELHSLADNAVAVKTSNDTVNEAMAEMSDAMHAMASALEAALNGDANAIDNITTSSSDLQTAGQKFTDEMMRVSAVGDSFAAKMNDLGTYLTDMANK